MAKKEYDVIIVGAGPAGLAVGSELSKKLDVLIIDKGKLGQTCHEWTYWNDKIKKAGLTRFVAQKLKFGTARSPLGSSISIKLERVNKFIPSMYEDKVLGHFKRIMQGNKAEMKPKCAFKSLVKSKDSVIVKTSKGDFRGKLVIDAMGTKSPLAKKHKVMKRCYYIPVYGLTIKKIGLPYLEYNFMEPVIDKNPLPYWWSFPLDKKHDFVGIFYIARKMLSRVYMSKDFGLMLKKHQYTKGKKIKPVKEYFGNVPIACIFSQNDVDRVAFVGDSRGWASGFGWGFSPIIDNYRKVSKKLLKLYRKGNLSAYDLEKATEIKFNDPIKDLNARMEELVGVFLLNCTIDDFDRVLNVFAPYPGILEKLCTFRMSERDIIKVMRIMHAEFSLGEILGLFPKKDHRFLLSEILIILKDLELEAIGRIYRHFKD